MITMALYHFWQFLKLGGKARALLSATTLGLSQLAKYSCVYLYPIFLVTGAIIDARGSQLNPAYAVGTATQFTRCANGPLLQALFAGVSIVIINVGFGFDGFNTPLSKYTFTDTFLQNGPGDTNHC